MGRALLEQSAGVRARQCKRATRRCAVDGLVGAARCCAAKRAELPALERVDVVQPALFAMSVGLAALWR